MGLNAVVYKNAANVLKVCDAGRFEVDSDTGEVFSKAGETSTDSHPTTTAAHHRLGNVDEICDLRDEVQKVFGRADILLIQKVLYSGSHSGDVIAVSHLPSLRHELDVLKAIQNARFAKFIDSMTALVQASEDEQNPIVFV